MNNDSIKMQLREYKKTIKPELREFNEMNQTEFREFNKSPPYFSFWEYPRGWAILIKNLLNLGLCVAPECKD